MCENRKEEAEVIRNVNEEQEMTEEKKEETEFGQDNKSSVDNTENVSDQSDTSDASEENKSQNPINQNMNKEPEQNEKENSEWDYIRKLVTIPEQLELLLEQMKSMHLLFEDKISRTEYEEKIVDRMHGELQRYKEDMYSQLVRPILLDVIEVRDSILRVSAAHQNNTEEGDSIPIKTFSDYAYDLQDILERNNIEIYQSNEKDDFIPIRHRVAKKVITEEKEMHGKIAELISAGYSFNGKVIVPEKVAVYFYEENTKKE